MNEALNSKSVESFLSKYSIDRPAKEWRRQLYRGFKDKLKRASKKLDTAKRIALNLIPQDERESFTSRV